MDFFVLDTDPLVTTLHQLVHHPESDFERKIKRQRRERHHHDHDERQRHVTIATPVDVKEKEDAYHFIADVPGLRKSDIEVLVESDNVLTMRGKRKDDEDGETGAEEDTKFIRIERRPVKLMRKFTLPSNAKADGITAACVDGVLTVTVPKLPPPQPEKPKTVQIAVS